MASISNAAARAACDAIVDLLDVGAGTAVLRIYSGTVPANVDTALGAQVILSEHDLSNPAFGAAADGTPGGIATANAIADDASANAGGVPSFARAFDRDGTAVLQFTVGTGSEELVINASPITAGTRVVVTALTYNQPEA